MPDLLVVIERAGHTRQLDPAFDLAWEADSKRIDELFRAWKIADKIDRSLPYEGRPITEVELSEKYEHLQKQLFAAVQELGNPEGEEARQLQEIFIVRLLDATFIRWHGVFRTKCKSWLTYDYVLEELMKLQTRSAELMAQEIGDKDKWIAETEELFAAIADKISELSFLLDMVDNCHYHQDKLLQGQEQLFIMAEGLLLS